MTELTPGMQLQDLREGRPRGDGQAIAFRVQRVDTSSFDVWCPIDDLPKIFAYLAAVAQAAVELPGGMRERGLETNASQLPCLGIGVVALKDSAHLVVRLPGFDLAFALEGDRLLAVAEEFARVARTLSADSDRPH